MSDVKQDYRLQLPRCYYKNKMTIDFQTFTRNHFFLFC